MEHTQMLRVGKLNYSRTIIKAARHNLREIQAEIGADSHIDPLKSNLNVIVRGSAIAAEVAKEAVNLMEQGMEKSKLRRLRKDAVLGLEMLVSLPASSDIDEQAFFRDSIAWAEGFFEIPILSAIIHNDEAAPHCHVIMLPLFDGRMIGSGLVGNQKRLLAIQDDFHAKVGQAYGLKRGGAAKRYNRAARASASDRIVSALHRSPNTLDDPAIRDALRDVLVESMPVRLMELLGLDVPEVKTQKVKPDKPIGVHREKHIGFAPAVSAPKEQSISCVGFGVSAPDIPPTAPPITSDSEYIRESDSELTNGYWDEVSGEYIKLPVKTKRRSAEVDRVQGAIDVMVRQATAAMACG